jgi:hypothetical protein
VKVPIGEYVALMLAGERGIMDSLRYQSNLIYEAAGRGMCGAVCQGAKHQGQSRTPSTCDQVSTVVGESTDWGISGAHVGRERGIMDCLR